ncbi:MAG: hypothetical protein R3F25_08730 [Gammaproteobacteria bacterium]|nr:hypothetical protein [Xanthomonadales bacterium]
MEKYLKKIKHIIPAYIAVTFITTSVVLLFRWFFTIRNDFLHINEEVFFFYIPLILPLIVSFIWLSRKFRILRFVNYHKSVMIYEMIVYAAFFGTLMSSNYYLNFVTSEITEVTSINNLHKNNSRYLAISDIDLEFDMPSIHIKISTSGGGFRFNRRRDLTFTAYIVIPFKVENFKDIAYWDESENYYKFWYGIKFYKTIEKSLPEREKEKLYEEFLKQVESNYSDYDLDKPEYFEVLSSSEDLDGYTKAISESYLESYKNPVVIVPLDQNPKNNESFYLLWIFISFGGGLLLLSFALIFPKVNNNPLPHYPNIFEIIGAIRKKK